MIDIESMDIRWNRIRSQLESIKTLSSSKTIESYAHSIIWCQAGSLETYLYWEEKFFSKVTVREKVLVQAIVCNDRLESALQGVQRMLDSASVEADDKVVIRFYRAARSVLRALEDQVWSHR